MTPASADPPPARGDSAAVARRLAPSLVAVGDSTERPITVDQTNYSVVVGEAAIVKWLRPARPLPHRASTLAAHLRDVGFTEMPRFYGAEIVDGLVVATVSEFLPGAVDGWEWYVDDLTTELDASGRAVACVAVAQRLGGLAARLHRALATVSVHLPDPVGVGTASDERRRAVAVLDSALGRVDGAAAGVLVPRADRIRAVVDSIAAVGPLDVQHLHGDLHVGQLLRCGDGIVVTDFDGNPLDVPTIVPSSRRSAMVDLAALVQSVDHVGRIVTNRRPDLRSGVDEFIAAATAEVIRGYGSVAPVEADLLAALRTVQELHELLYAATHLPRWSYVPEAALTAMYP